MKRFVLTYPHDSHYCYRPSFDVYLAKAFVDEINAFLTANDGWNADGSMGGRQANLVPFTGDFSFEDSEGNQWKGYTPQNTPYKARKTEEQRPGGWFRLRTIHLPVLTWLNNGVPAGRFC